MDVSRTASWHTQHTVGHVTGYLQGVVFTLRDFVTFAM